MKLPVDPRFNSLLLCYYGASKLPHPFVNPHNAKEIEALLEEPIGLSQTPRFNTLLL